MHAKKWLATEWWEFGFLANAEQVVSFNREELSRQTGICGGMKKGFFLVVPFVLIIVDNCCLQLLVL